MRQLIRLAGFLLLGVIIWRSDTDALGAVLSEARGGLLLAAFGLSLISLFFKALRWNAMLGAQGFKYSFHRAFIVYLAGIYIGLATPGRLGELARLLYVKRDFNVNAGVGLSSVVVDRLCDLYMLVAVGCLAILRFAVVGDLSPFFFVGLAAMLVIPLVLLNPAVGRWFTNRLLGRTVRRKLRHVLVDGVDDFFRGLEKMLGWRLLVWGGLTIAAYVFFFGAAQMIAISLGIPIRFTDTVLVLGLANLLSLIPITVAGVGTRDAVFIFTFAFLALSEAQALAFSALVLAVFYLGGGAIGFLCFLADRPAIDAR